MMVFPEFNQELYDVVQVEVGYCKMFSHILEDFPTREDVKKMMETSNLPVQTTVSTTVTVSGVAAAPQATSTTNKIALTTKTTGLENLLIFLILSKLMS